MDEEPDGPAELYEGPFCFEEYDGPDGPLNPADGPAGPAAL
mgnify:CR=1 FL=1